MKLLFCIRSFDNFYYMRSIAYHLYANGHEVKLLFDKEWSKRESSEAVDLFLSGSKSTADWLKCRRGVWRKIIFLLRELRSCANYVWRKGGSPYHKKRWFGYIPFYFRPIAYLLAPFQKRYNYIERLISPVADIVNELKEFKPDVVIATPCNHRFSNEIEYIKAAKHLGIPTVIVVFSYDNLTTKGIFSVIPDKLLVWNEMQHDVASKIHGVSSDLIEIIGSPFFERWYGRANMLPIERQAFCQSIGIKATDTFCLYLGSSANIAEDETWLVEKLCDWFPDIYFLVRPHPANYKNYLWLKKPNLIVSPRNGDISQSYTSTLQFFSALKHCAVAIGINTSGMIDAIINDTPCATLLVDEYKLTQAEALHFNPIENTVFVARRFEELAQYIVSCCNSNNSGYASKRMSLLQRLFVRKFVFPNEGILPSVAALKSITSLVRKETGNEHRESEHNRMRSGLDTNTV